MKNNTKRIVAGIGLGAVLAGGALLTTGCSTDLSTEQMNNIMQTVENADKFMDAGNQYFSRDNMFDKQSIVSQYHYAVGALLLNKDNVWDNLTLKAQRMINSDNLETEQYHFYKTSEDVNVAYRTQVDAVTGEVKVDGYFDNKENSQATADESTIIQHTFVYKVVNKILGTDSGMFHELKESEIAKVEISDDGVISVSAYTNKLFGEDDICIIEFSLDANGRMLSISYNYMQKIPSSVGNMADHYSQSVRKFEYEYGKLTEAEVQGNLSKLN